MRDIVLYYQLIECIRYSLRSMILYAEYIESKMAQQT
jgi:hypothetical protein